MLGGSDDSHLSVEAQLAVIRTKVDILIDLARTRGEEHEARIRDLEINGAGEDHENRIRKMELEQSDYLTRKAAITMIVVTCTVATAIANFIALWLR